MIHEVKQPSSSLLALDCPFPEARAVIAGDNPGWLFADDLHPPRAAMIWAQGIEGFYLIGDAKSVVFLRELDAYAQQVLKPRLHAASEDLTKPSPRRTPLYCGTIVPTL